MRLIIHGRIGNHVVLEKGVGVHTHLCVQCNDGIALLGALCGDDNDTVGTTGTIQGVGGGVLKNGHGLHVVRVDVVDVSVVRHAVHNIQRGVSC